MQDFKKLSVWKKGHDLTLSVYRMTNSFPREENFGLTSQLRRSCASIPANIAEGCGRGSNKELSRFLRISFGSLSETEYHLLLVKDLGWIAPEKYNYLNNHVEELKKMLSGLIKTLDQKNNCQSSRTNH